MTLYALCRLTTGTELTFLLFPFGRNRYRRLILEQLGNHPVFLFQLWKIHSFVIARSDKVNLIVSSDFVNGVNSEYVAKLNSIDFEVFLWNDETEALEVIRNFDERRLTFLSFFSFPGVALRGRAAVEVPVFRFSTTSNAGVPQKRLFFAGGVHPSYFDEVLESDPASQEVGSAWLRRLSVELPNFMFEEQTFAQSGLDVQTYAALRHKCVNHWRRDVIIRLVEEFGSKIWLLGDTFYGEPFQNATVLRSTERISKYYRDSSLNLDLGSQCGGEYVYPRSLEIHAVRPQSLITFVRASGTPLRYSVLWSSVEELVEQTRISLL